jgi:hypothetical protein
MGDLPLDYPRVVSFNLCLNYTAGSRVLQVGMLHKILPVSLCILLLVILKKTIDFPGIILYNKTQKGTENPVNQKGTKNMKKFALIDDIGCWEYKDGKHVTHCAVERSELVAEANTREELAHFVSDSYRYHEDGTWHNYHIEPRAKAKKILSM